jgi:hypothetical protein
MKYRTSLILVIFLVLTTAQWTSAQITVTRSFSRITLGMSIQELQTLYETKEIASSSLLTGERLFGIDGQFPGVARVLCTFYLGKLFQIEVSYTPQFTRRVPWESFVEPVKKKYGEGWSFQSPQGEVMIWNDGKTSFILEQKASPQSPSIYVASLADDAMYNARQESCPSRKYKV